MPERISHYYPDNIRPTQQAPNDKQIRQELQNLLRQASELCKSLRRVIWLLENKK